ncbi:type IX secretion system sortase PorU [Gracilimonas sp.]|uniref:type IX secretion system sortase PorU n=1 Tax=Gracilimonas sp. TaxID=1974203 RepID=UPI002871353D|nr:type IX secretion system sortase PorU [Gracilimonas sp.]
MAEARQLKVVAETESFTDYEFINDELTILSPIGLTVPVSGSALRYQILEQDVAIVQKEISPEKAMVLALEGDSRSLIEASEPGISRGKKVSSLSINIARYGDNNVRILKKLRLRVYKTGDSVLPNMQLSKANGPSFSTGVWYKIPIRKNGIYNIGQNYLEELGINVNSIDPQHIQLWGTGGALLPEANSEARPEFKQIPILVQGQSDGSFDTGDRIIFYANSPDRIDYNDVGFSHQVHPYSKKNYIFLTIAAEPGMRLSPVNENLTPSRSVSTFTDFIWKEQELYKPEDRIKSGRNWLGTRFEASSNESIRTVLRDTLPGLLPNQTIEISGQFVNRSTSSANFDLFLNNDSFSSLFIPRSGSYNSSEGNAGIDRSFTENVSASFSGDILEIAASYNHNASGSTGFLDWLEITAERELVAENEYLYFFSPEDGSSSELVNYQLSGFDNQPIIMEVSNPTDPKLLALSESGQDFNFNYYSGNNLHFIADSEFEIPEIGEPVAPQDLQSITTFPDYIIITADVFKDYADDLAAYRQQNDGLTPVVVTQEEIINEFSGGLLDPTAIRDYVKFLYDRALNSGQEPPKYLLLFGDTTFDYKNIQTDRYINHVVTYQSEESLGRTTSYATDDFFGLLDDNEGEMDVLGSGGTPNSHLLDIGLGRISAQTPSEAAIAIQKIKEYESPEHTGSWQNTFTFAADDDFPDVQLNRDLHVLNADATAERMNIIEPGIKVNKVYEFSYPEEITGSGRTIPGATEDFINAFNNGTLVLNYSGHGNEQTLSDEELFKSDYIPSLTNRDRLSVLVTATCQFGRYDDNDAQSGAEKLFFADNGGLIAAFTTTRVVYTGSGISSRNNFGLNVALSQRMVERNQDSTPLRFGDIYRKTKNTFINNSSIISTRNSKKFILIGDPAGRFRLPEFSSEVASLNDYTESGQDTVLTVQALDQVTLSGTVKDLEGNTLSDFSGEVNLTVLDAKRNVNLPADRDWVQADNCNLEGCSYTVENDVLFKGKTEAVNGEFSSTFIVPKDISFSDETGRILMYANNKNGKTASGSFVKVRFNGINEDAVDDGKGPELDVYLNDEKFVNGNLVNNSPQLIVDLEDQSGINTTGTGVGHEIIATIDTKPKQSFVLNEFYEGNLNDFTRGRIEYPLDNLPEGSYSLMVRAWDVHNNPSEKEIVFEVASSEELSIRNVYNYPNPMNNATRFTFEHNQPGNPFDVSVQIFTLSGQPVQHIENQLITTSSYASISWNGRDRDHNRLGNGTYIYVLRVTANTPKGRQQSEKIEKLVIIR